MNKIQSVDDLQIACLEFWCLLQDYKENGIYVPELLVDEDVTESVDPRIDAARKAKAACNKRFGDLIRRYTRDNQIKRDNERKRKEQESKRKKQS
jgi:hypothetical protein